MNYMNSNVLYALQPCLHPSSCAHTLACLHLYPHFHLHLHPTAKAAAMAAQYHAAPQCERAHEGHHRCRVVVVIIALLLSLLSRCRHHCIGLSSSLSVWAIVHSWWWLDFVLVKQSITVSRKMADGSRVPPGMLLHRLPTILLS
jgi:hypothetical protein